MSAKNIGSVEKHGGRDSYIMASFPASTCRGGRKYLRERLHVLAWRMQCTASEIKKTGTEIVSLILDKKKGR